MTTINLKDFYYWYLTDVLVEVPDEVAEELIASKRREAAHAERVRYNKAYYSLDCDDGIEYSACLHEHRHIVQPPGTYGSQGAVLPAVERPQLLAGNSGSPRGRSFDPWKELPPDCPRGGCGQERRSLLREMRN